MFCQTGTLKHFLKGKTLLCARCWEYRNEKGAVNLGACIVQASCQSTRPLELQFKKQPTELTIFLPQIITASLQFRLLLCHLPLTNWFYSSFHQHPVQERETQEVQKNKLNLRTRNSLLSHSSLHRHNCLSLDSFTIL